ncbi:MAG: hypothetical protein AAF360_16470 [Pseudomonadota bacterium]
MTETLVFDGARDLAGVGCKLKSLRTSIGPNTGARRPQDKMDLWVALSWVVSTPAEYTCELRIFQRESPDFKCVRGDDVFGLEVTEVANQEERNFNMEQYRACPKGPRVAFLSDKDPSTDIPFAVEWCAESLRKKEKKCAKYAIQPCDLIIYFNSANNFRSRRVFRRAEKATGSVALTVQACVGIL